MSDPEDKKPEAKVEGVDVSGYMPPGMGPVSPYPPDYCPPGPEPGMPDHGMMTLANKLKSLKHQEVTVYVMGMSPVASIQTIPAGPAVMPSAGPFGITGMLHEVGADYLVLHVSMGTTRVVYIPLAAVAAVVPGGPLVTPSTSPSVSVGPGVL